MSVSSEFAAPHGLDLIVEFVNTRDIDEGTDTLASPADLAAWLQSHGLIETDAELAARDHRRAVDLREALREALLAHNRAPGPTGAELLESVAERGRLSVRFAPDGELQVAPRVGGLDGALARLLVPIAHGASDGTWARVKACASDDCQWAFYDRSRNRSGRWCDMAVCGNRTKVRAYRSKR